MTPSGITTPESSSKSTEKLSAHPVEKSMRPATLLKKPKKDKNNWRPNQTSKGNRLTHPRATCVGKRQQNPPHHHSDMHSAEYAQEQDSLPSEDMEQVMRQLKEFLQDKLNTDDHKLESCLL